MSVLIQAKSNRTPPDSNGNATRARGREAIFVLKLRGAEDIVPRRCPRGILKKIAALNQGRKSHPDWTIGV
eukprot:4534227-Pyramimonas_sp.AAC.1